MPDRDASSPRSGITPGLGLPPEDLESRRLRAECARELFGEDAPDLMKIGRFALLSQLGTGGQGAVYVADDPELGRRVALKRLVATDPQHAQRLRREGQALARVSHPHVVTVYEVGEDELQRPFLVMELVDGQPLHRWLHKAPRRWTEIVDVLLPVGEGLAAIHAAGLVHRDVKPHNIVITDDGQATLVDLGIAVEGVEAPAGTREADATATAAGTVGYMAPEHRAGHATAHSDQFSFCVTLYEALHGVRPPLSMTRPVRDRRHRRDHGLRIRDSGRSPDHDADRDDGSVTPPGPGRSDTEPAESSRPVEPLESPPRAVLRAISRGLQDDPALRHPDMTALVQALRRARQRRRWPALVLGALIVVGTAVAMRFTPAGPCDELQVARGLWHEQARETVRTAFTNTGSTDAAPTFATVDAMLDAATGALDERLARVCAAPLEPTAQQLALAEIVSQQTALRTIVGSLHEVAAPELVEVPLRLAPLLQRLYDHGPRDACEQTEATPQPSPLLEQIETTRQQAVAQGIAGHPDAALALAERAHDLAQGQALAPVRARLHLAHGRLALDAQRLDVAREQLDAARSQAETLGCDGLGAEALALWAKAQTLDEHGAIDQAAQATRTALEKLDRLGIEGARRAEALNSRGLVLHRQRDYPGAAASFREAIEIRQALGPPARIDLALSTQNLGNTLARQGHTEAAIETLEQAREHWEAALWPEHPGSYKLHANLGYRHLERGDLAAAQQALDRALALAEARLGPQSLKLANLHVAMTQVLDLGHQFEAALQHATRADEIMVASAGPDDVRRIVTLEAIGQVCMDAGWPQRAVPMLEQSLQLQARAGPDDPVSLAIGRGKLAQAHGRLEDHDTALLLYEQALRPFADPSLRLDSYYPELLFGWGETLVALGRHDQAQAPLREAVAWWSEQGNNPERLAHARWWLAQASCAYEPPSAMEQARLALAYFDARESQGDARMHEEISSWIERGCPPTK